MAISPVHLLALADLAVCTSMPKPSFGDVEIEVGSHGLTATI
jgi:hypothetical protein